MAPVAVLCRGGTVAAVEHRSGSSHSEPEGSAEVSAVLVVAVAAAVQHGE